MGLDANQLTRTLQDTRFVGCRYYACFKLLHHTRVLMPMSPSERTKCPYEEALIEVFKTIVNLFRNSSPQTRVNLAGALGLVAPDNRSVYDVDPRIVGHTIAGA